MINAITQAIDKGKSGSGSKDQLELFYAIRPANWHQTFPFFFDIMDKDNKLVCRFFLPIPPSNVTVQDMSTSEAHATIGGVVEETSRGVFSMITLTGTTGLSSSALNLSSKQEDFVLDVKFRKYVADLNGSNSVVGKLLGSVVNGALGAVSGVSGDSEARLQYQESGSAVTTPGTENSSIEVQTLAVAGGQKSSGGVISDFFQRQGSSILNAIGQGPASESRSPFSNGFAWSHALRQFFLIYQRIKSEDNEHALYFVDGKANTRYRCVVRSAQFTQNVNQPYLINYNISLKCWELSSSAIPAGAAAINRFAKGGDLEEVYTATAISAITSFSRTIKNFKRPGGVAGALVKNSTSSII